MDTFECYRCKFNTKNKKDIERHFRLHKCKPKYSNININDYKDPIFKGISTNDYINQSINNKNRKPIELLLKHISVLNNQILKQNILIQNIESFYQNKFIDDPYDDDDQSLIILQNKINHLYKSLQ